MQVCALHSPPVRCTVAQASCAVGGVITVTKKNLVLHHRLYFKYTHYGKKTKLSVSTCTLRTLDYMLRQFLLSVRASVLIHEPSRAVLARGTFESIAVTNNCTNTLHYRTAVELLPDGNIECPSRIEECARGILLMACYLATLCPRDQTQCRVW